MISRQKRFHLIALAATTIVVAGAGTAVALADGASGTATHEASTSVAPAAGVDTQGFPSGGRNPGIFTDRCAFSHEAADDPILDPGKPGMSMHHDFFGNTGTNASSTPASLVSGATTCSTGADASAYWIPVLYQNGRALQPKSSLQYWRQRNALATKVEPMPAGLTMIAGNEKATSAQSRKVVKWSCKTGRGVRAKHNSSTPPTCPGGAVKLTIFFPSCWDGHTLNGAKQTNVVYPDRTGCPSAHPVEIPQIVFHTTYHLTNTRGLSLSTMPMTSSSGGSMPMTASIDTEHADFMNGWTQSRLNADTAACIRTQTRCGKVSGPDATPRGGKQRPRQQHARHHRR